MESQQELFHCPGRSHPHGQPYQHLECQHPDHGPRPQVRSLHQGQYHHGGHIGKGVVGAAFQFQQGSSPVFQVHLLGTEDGEHGSCVRRTDDAAQEHPLQKRQAQDLHPKKAHQGCRHEGPRAGKEKGFLQHRPGRFQIGPQAPIEHDQHQGRTAEISRMDVVVKRNLQEPIRPKEHPQQDEKEQAGHTGPAEYFVKQGTGDQHDPCEQNQMFHRNLLG